MRWWAAAATAVATVAIFWGPGYAVLRTWRWRGGRLGALAVAPLVTTGLFALAAIAAEPARVPWNAATAAVVTSVACGVGWLWSRSRSGSEPRPPDTLSVPARWRVRLRWAVVAGVAAQLVPFAIGMGRPDRYLTAHDTTFHLAAVARIRETGLASSLHLTAAARVHGDAGTFYGAGWHDTAALVPQLPDPTVVSNVITVLPAMVAWTIGLAFLCQVTLPSRPRTWVLAPILGSAGVVLPMTMALWIAGQTANATAMAFLPAALALAVHAVKARPVAVPVTLLAAAGVVLTHPNVGFTAGVILAPALVRLAVTWVVADRPGRPRRVLTAMVVVGAAAAGLVALTTTSEYRAVTTWIPDAPLSPADAAMHLLSGNGRYYGWSAGFVVMLAAFAGVVLGRRLRQAWWQWAGFVAICVLYLLTTSAIPFLTDLDRLWYGEPSRFAAAIGAMAVPPAALAFDSSTRALRRLAVREHRPAWVATAAMTGLVLAPALVAAVGVADLTRYTYQADADHGVLADDDELALARRLDTELDHDVAVLGSPFAGTFNLRDRFGQAVQPPSEIVRADPDMTYIEEHLATLGHDAALCVALEHLGIGYLYVDPEPWNSVDGMIKVTAAPADGVELVDSGGTASVYRITACG